MTTLPISLFVKDGQKSFHLNKGLKDCPEFSLPIRRKAWRAGWRSAHRGESLSVAALKFFEEMLEPRRRAE